MNDLTWLADHSLRVAALILVVGVGSLLARRASAHSRLFAWTIVLYVAATMPLFVRVLPDVPVPDWFSEPVIVMTDTSNAVEPLRPEAHSSAAPQPSSTLPWPFALYIAGAVLLLTRLAAGTHLTTRLLRRAKPVDDGALGVELRALSSALRLSRVPHVVQHESVHVPFVSGALRPALVLPVTWTSWDAATRQAVLTHELSHLVRRDLWTMRAASFYCALTWLNPLSWWLLRKLETQAERASDDAVLASGVEPTAYAEMLVQFFGAAQRAPGRASWQLAMARRGGVEAGKRIGRVLNTREGGHMKFGMPGRVLVVMGVMLAAVPVIALSASRSGAVAVQHPHIVDRGLDLRQAQVTPSTSRGESQAALRSVAQPSRQQIKQLQIDRTRAASDPALDDNIAPQVQAQVQEQEPEPWRSTKKGTDADVAVPTLLRLVHPKYTAEAMRANIQGNAAVEVIVSPEGDVTAARISQSLDKDLGLDGEALKAAFQWKFRPGTYQGQAVAVRVIIELEFRLH